MDKKYVIVLFTVLLTALMSPFNLRAQSPGSEADVINDAATKFDAQDYAAAMPLYSQLLANHPNDPNYNYRFGVCMLFANADKGKALPFLEEASKDPKAEVEVWFYLGRAYHLNYRFDEAIVAYNKYKTLAGQKKAEKMQVDNQIAQCKTGKKLLKAVTDITVLEKKELSAKDFFRSYDLSGYSGELLVKGDEFKTNLDRKKNETSIIFLSGEKNMLYFSSYGDNEENGKDIYRVVRLPNGGWSKPFNVGYPINTEFDEDYPFLHPNGKVLYFSSKGHNSMGGYDIFRSELNEEVGSWLKPVNMDFAINSPDDDILFVTDMEEKTAWFASARNSPQGMMTVYHVVIERKPVDMLIIAGTFKPTGVDPNAGAKITVRNEETNQPVGVYKSNDQTGSYLINLPSTGGKYTFTVEKSGIHTQTKTVFVPPQYEMKPIRQEIFYSETNGEQDLNIVTYFDDDTAQFAPDFLKDKANLDVSPEDASSPYEVVELGLGNPKNPANPGDPANPGNESDSNDVPGGGVDPADNVPSSQGAVSTEEAISAAYTDADETKKEAVATHQQADRAYAYAAELDQKAKDKQAEADAAKKEADALPPGPGKTDAQERANQLQGEANALQSQTVAAFNVAEGLSEDANQKDKEAKVAEEYATALDEGSKKTGPHAMDDANTKLQELNDVSDVRSQGEETAKNLQEQADQKREQLQAARTKADDAREEKKSNEALIQQLRADSAKEKDPDLRESYASQIVGIQENIADNNADIKKADANVARLQNEVNDLDNQATAAKNALTESKNPEVAPVAMTPEKKKELSENVVGYQNRVEDPANPVAVAPVAPKNPEPKNPDPVVGDPKNPDPVVGDPKNPDPVVGDPKNPDPVVSDPKNPEPKNPGDPIVSPSEVEGPDPVVPAEDVIADVQGGVSEKIQEAENIDDPVKKEQAIGDAHREAEKNLDEKIASAQNDLKNEKDPGRQKQIQDNINQLTEEKQHQHDLAVQSDQRVKDAQATASVENPKDPFAVYSDNIASADSLPDPVVREQKKADTYTDWAEAMDQKIAEDKKLMGATKDKETKDSLKIVIANDQKTAQDLKQQAKDAKAAEQKAIAEQNSPGAKSNKAFADQVAESNSNPDVKERETAKESIYETWADSLENEAVKLDNLAAKERNAKKKQDYQNQAQDLRNQAEEKRNLAQDAHNAAEQSSIAAQPKNPEPGPQAAVPADAVVEEGIIYSDPESKHAIEDRNNLQKDADAFRRQQDSLIAAAGSAQGEEKTELLADASDAQRKAWDKEAEASTKQGEANEEQFQTNAAVLDGYKSGAAESNDPKVEAAGLLNDESITLLRRAKDKRVEAKLATSQYQRSEALKEAEDLEQKAIKKQQEAIAMYQEAGVQPGAVAVEPKQPDPQNPDPVVGDPKQPDPKNPEPFEQRIINPSTGDPYTPEQVEQIRETPAYKNYVATEQEANVSDKQAAELDKKADQYQKSADDNITKAQDYAIKASDESDPATKRMYLDSSKAANERAKKDIARRDSVKDIADNARLDAKTKHGEADLFLNELDKKTYDDVKAVAAADQKSGDPNARHSENEPKQPDPVVVEPKQPDPVIVEPKQPDPVVVQPKQPDPSEYLSPAKDPVVVQPADPSDKSKTGSQLKPGEQFKITSQPNAAPIPVDPPVPTGIVYKVQIGAFRNPIPVDLFKGIQPLTAESVGNGITRYTAGLFTDFANADAAKREIRAMGYPDAFVVAYKDGKRISIGEARRLQGQGGSDPVVVDPKQPNPPIPDNPNPQPRDVNPGNPDPVVPQPKQADPQGSGFVAEATDVKTTQELFYTVQVGVYSRPVSPERLYNLGGLFSERTANGYIRYASGKYNNVSAAIEAKDDIVAIGIKDAFVTAYFEGQRISLDKAAELERSGIKPSGNVSANVQRNNGGQVVQPAQQPQPQPKPEPVVKEEPKAPTWQPEPQPKQPEPQPKQPEVQPQPQPQPEMTPIPVIANTKPNIPDTGLVFCVQLGAYKEFVPIAMANRFLQFASKGVSIYRDQNSGLTVYQVGVYVTYKDAQALKDDAIAKGINDAFIVAWHNGEKISIEEALKIRPQ